MDPYYEDSTVSDIFSTSQSLQGNTTTEKAAMLPYDIPDCPESTYFLDLYYFPMDLFEDLFPYKPADKIMIISVFPIVLTVGILANFAFLFTVARDKEMRSITNFYLANIAFADLTFAITSLVKDMYPYIWSNELDRGEPYRTRVGCALASTSPVISYFASICLVTLVSIERYLAICHPLKHRMVNKKSRAIKLVILSWLIGFAGAALVAPNTSHFAIYCVVWPKKYQHFPTVIGFCSTIDPIGKHFFRDLSTIAYFVPFFLSFGINSTMYAFIVVRLSQRNISDNGGETNGPAAQAQKIRNSVARMSVINGTAFFSCLAPYVFFQTHLWVIRNFDVEPLDPGHMITLARAGRFLNILNSAINPFIYGLANARYRQAFIKAIGCESKIRRKPENEATSSTALSMVSKGVTYRV